uniref:C-type lectin domain family 9 member A isoform X2 n=1 Tax=Scatophagus argus TaxID=75038 RepID=UPI001ED83604|nr:C-type lectin domain family 9 member A isoform X2 [Scatophagus argus]
MYIKFCSSYGEDKKDEANAKLSPQSKLSVELEGEKDKQAEGKASLYRAGCVLLTIICLILLLIVIILGVKLQTGSMICPEGGEPKAADSEKPKAADSEEPKAAERQIPPSASVCSLEQCHTLFPNGQIQYRQCQQCAKGWLTFGHSCFFLSTSRLSWDESQRNCSSRGGSLAIINSPEVQRFLTQKGKMNYWIGLRRNRDTWSWVNNTVLQESYWMDVKSEGDCGILRSGSPSEKNWIRAACEAYTYFICQLDM